MSTATKIFEDGVNYTDHSKFIDYPQVKLRSYESGKFTSIKKITIYLFTFSVMSALAAFFLVVR